MDLRERVSCHKKEGVPHLLEVRLAQHLAHGRHARAVRVLARLQVGVRHAHRLAADGEARAAVAVAARARVQLVLFAQLGATGFAVSPQNPRKRKRQNARLLIHTPNEGCVGVRLELQQRP